MYTALAIMFSGILFGRIAGSKFSKKFINMLIMLSILVLLFLLGFSIGINQKIFDNLGSYGAEALAIMLFCVFGSIICNKIIASYLLAGKKKKN